MRFSVEALYELHYQMITLGKVCCSLLAQRVPQPHFEALPALTPEVSEVYLLIRLIHQAYACHCDCCATVSKWQQLLSAGHARQ